MLSTLRYWILWLSTPVQKWVQRRGRLETKMTRSMVRRAMWLINPGDILLSYEGQRWTSWFIKGFYDHAVIVTNRGTIVEAVGDMWFEGENMGGVREVPLEEWLYKKDFVAAVRTTLSKDLAKAAAAIALDYIGREYDYCFCEGDERIYCSELPYLCYRSVWSDFLKDLPPHREILPQQYLDLTKSVNYLIEVFDTKKKGLIS